MALAPATPWSIAENERSFHVKPPESEKVYFGVAEPQYWRSSSVILPSPFLSMNFRSPAFALGWMRLPSLSTYAAASASLWKMPALLIR